MIFVAGLSGHLSGRVARLLAARGVPFRGSSRTPERVADLGAAEVLPVSYDDVDALARALAGTSRFLLVSTPAAPEDVRVGLHLNAIEAARRAGVAHLVYTSFQDLDPASPFPAAGTHVRTEEALRASGLPVTFLRAGLYMDNLPQTARQALRSGVHAVPAGTGATAYLAREDLAEVAAAVLERGGFEGEALEVTGPEALTQADLAGLFSRVAGREVRYVDAPEEGWRADLAALGFPPPAVYAMGGIYAAIKGGHFARVGDGVPRVLGREGTRAETLLRAAFAGDAAGEPTGEPTGETARG